MLVAVLLECLQAPVAAATVQDKQESKEAEITPQVVVDLIIEDPEGTRHTLEQISLTTGPINGFTVHVSIHTDCCMIFVAVMILFKDAIDCNHAPIAL